MGRAIRWLKGLFGIKDNKEQKHHSAAAVGHTAIIDPTVLCNNPTTVPPNISAAEAAWLSSFYRESEMEQSKHAIAVAAATAAAADAAVAAANAAVAVVRLTSHGRGTMFGGGRERWAAVRIQTVFRGYLARRALKALKGLVKLQAVVRGFLVRKQADETLHSMQALIRAQASVRSHRARARLREDPARASESKARKSTERFDDTKSDHAGSVHSRRLSGSLDTVNVGTNIDESPKIVEVDPGTGRPRSSRSSRRAASPSPSIPDCCDHDHMIMPVSSPLPCQALARVSVPGSWSSRDVGDPDWGLTGDECRFSTAHSTPRFMASSVPNSARSLDPVVTPARTQCPENYFCGPHPNYMADTQSFRAKLRSHSAPKQRPEPHKKRVSLNELMAARSSLSGTRMQRSCSNAQDAVSFKNAVMGKLHRSSDFAVRETEKIYMLMQRRN